MLLDLIAILGLIIILTFPISLYVVARWGFSKAGEDR